MYFCMVQKLKPSIFLILYKTGLKEYPHHIPVEHALIFSTDRMPLHNMYIA